ncbi:MAG: DUF1080 domain-containing protein [Balneolales bacterium]
MLLFVATTVYCQDPADTEVWEPKPKIVEPGNIHIEAPSDAIILFDGTSFEEWEIQNWDADGPEEIKWTLEDDYMTSWRRQDLKTHRKFTDVQLHVEWRVPEEIVNEGQRRGNSGIYLQGRYELQIMDGWENPTYSNGMAGSVYKQHIPLANPVKRPGEWQTFDIFYKAPVFDDGNVEEPARITVLWNGILIQNNVEVYGTTRYIGEPEYEAHGPAAIRLQGYAHSQVSFRNIWVRELDQEIIHTDGIRGGSR